MAWYFGSGPVLFREIFSITIAWFVVLIILQSRKILEFFFVDEDRVLLISFAFLMTIMGISFSIDTEFQRYKNFIRGIYYFYSFFLSLSIAKKIPRSVIYLFTILLFSSFQFQWAYTLGELKSLPLFILALTFLYEINVEKKSKTPIFLQVILVLLPLILFVANLKNQNIMNGIEDVITLCTAIIIFFAIYHDILSIRNTILTINFLSFLYSIYFIASMMVKVSIDPGYSMLFSKHAFIGGVNVNDISGFYVTALMFLIIFFNYFPHLAILNFSLALVVLVAVKSRFPLLIVLITLVIYFLSKNDIFLKMKKIKWIVVAMFFILSLLIYYLFFQRPFYEHEKINLSYLTGTETLKIRESLWQLSWETISHNVIFGTGTNNLLPILTIPSAELPLLNEVFGQGLRFTHAHNIILQWWLNGGVIYLLLYGVILFIAVLHGIYHRDKSINSGSFAILATVLEGLMNYHLMSHSVLILLWIAVALVFKNGFPPQKNIKKTNNWIIFGSAVAVIFYLAILSVHFRMMQIVNEARNWDNYDNLILDSNIDLSENKINEALNISSILVSLSFSERKFRQQYAEINFYHLMKDKSKNNLINAENAYQKSAGSLFENPLVFYRLAQIDLLKGNLDAEKRNRELAQKYDKFKLINQRIHHY